MTEYYLRSISTVNRTLTPSRKTYPDPETFDTSFGRTLPYLHSQASSTHQSQKDDPHIGQTPLRIPLCISSSAYCMPTTIILRGARRL